MEFTTATDRELFTEFLQADQSLGDPDMELTGEQFAAVSARWAFTRAEVERRFGEGATDRTAEWFTATRANSDDMIDWAVNQTERLADIARGDHGCDNDSLNVQAQHTRTKPSRLAVRGQCWCGRIWHREPGSQTWLEGPVQ